MSFLTGSGASLQVGKESTFGVGVSPTALIDITSESLKVSVQKGDSGSLLASKTAMGRDLLGISAEGSVSFILRPQSAGLLFHLITGGVDSCEAIDGTEKYKHTFVLCGANVDLPSASIVVDRKAAIKRYPGCTLSALSLECAAGDYVKGTLDIKGIKEEEGTLNASLTSFSVPPYRCTSAIFKVGDTVFDISKATVKIDNALEDAPKTYASGVYPGRPQHATRKVSLDFEIPYSAQVETFKNSYLTTEENASVELSFTSSNQDYKVEISVPNLSINDVSNSISGTGLINATVNGEALSIGDDEPITIVLTDKSDEVYGG